MTPRSGRTDFRWHFLLFSLFVLACTLGSLSAYLALAGSLFYLGGLRNREERRAIAAESAFQYFAVAVLFLLVAFSISAQRPADVVFIFDFSIFLVAPLAFLAARRHAGRAGLRTVASYALVGAFAAAASGVVQVWVLDIDRATVWDNNPLHFANVASALGWTAAVGIFAREDRWRWMYLLGPVFGLLAVLSADARGALLAYPLLSLVLLGMLARSVLTRWQFTGALILGVVAIAAGLLARPRLLDTIGTVMEIASGGQPADNSTLERLQMWSMGSEAFLSSPWFGFGWAHFMDAARALGSSTMLQSIATYKHLHSDIMDFAVAAGVLGIAAYVMLIVAPIASAVTGPRDALREARLTGTLLLCGGYAIYGLTNMNFGYELQTNFYALCAAILLGVTRADPPPSRASL